MEVMSTRGISMSGGMPKVMGSSTIAKHPLNTSNTRHITPAGPTVNPERVNEGFAGALNSALGNVEKLDVRAQKLTTQAVYDPESVDAHTLLIAGEKARFALTLTKTLADGFIRSYKELTSPR